MNYIEKLQKVQSELKAPKSLYNSFGKYNYRSTENILEGVKPLLAEVKAVITIHDKIVNIGDRFYIEATATFRDAEKPEDAIEVSALAREEASKKGMDSAQLSGSTSSYARKYALAGLLCLDDTADSDTLNQGQTQESKSNGKTNNGKTSSKPPSKPQEPDEDMATMIQAIISMANEKGLTPELLDKGVGKYFPGKDNIGQLNSKQLGTMMDKISQMEAAS